MKYKDPFLGEVNLTKIATAGVDVIYMDDDGNYYINYESSDNATNPMPMTFIKKATVDKIKSLF